MNPHRYLYFYLSLPLHIYISTLRTLGLTLWPDSYNAINSTRDLAEEDICGCSDCVYWQISDAVLVVILVLAEKQLLACFWEDGQANTQVKQSQDVACTTDPGLAS